jgi:hypothetical protein
VEYGSKVRPLEGIITEMTRSGECVGYYWGRMILDMDKTREFWLRLGVIGGALILITSAMAAFFG